MSDSDGHIAEDSHIAESTATDRRSPVLPSLVFAVGVVAFTVATLGKEWYDTPELLFWLPVIQLCTAVVIGFRCGRPASRIEWVAVLAAHSLLVMLVTLIAIGAWDWVLSQSVEGLFRLLLVLMWIAPLGGVLLIAETIRRRQLRWRPWIPNAIRFCLAATIVLIAVEGTAFVIERRRQPPPITRELPQAPGSDVRIAAIGGSTMLGFPYEPEWGIANVAVCQLQQMYPEQSFVLENLARTGMNLEQAVGEIRQLKYRPDILLVYSGHNEFFYDLEEVAITRKTAWRVDNVLDFSPTFRLISPVLARTSVCYVGSEKYLTLCSVQRCPDIVERRRLQRYTNHVQQLFRWAALSRVTVVYCVPASDAATFAPNESICASADPAVHAEIEAQWEHVRRLQETNQWTEALDVCRAVLNDHAEFAEFHFLAGRSCRALGDREAARNYFWTARNLDQLPIRAKDSYCEAGIAAATANGISVIDCPAILRRESTDGFPDQRFFLDGVHPNLRATFILGKAVATTIADSDRLPANGEQDPAPILSFEDCVHELGVTSETLSRAYERTEAVLKRYRDFRAPDDDARLRAAEKYKILANGLADGSIRPSEEGSETLEPRTLPETRN